MILRRLPFGSADPQMRLAACHLFGRPRQSNLTATATADILHDEATIGSPLTDRAAQEGMTLSVTGSLSP